MQIAEHVELNSYSTFMTQASARYFVRVESKQDIVELLETDVYENNKHYLLGEGSNTLFIGEVDALLIHIAISGLEIVEECEEDVVVRVGAGESWHNFVLFCIDQGLWGVENLILIPGTVGASPVQNIGAYGTEVSDTIVLVEGIDLETKEPFRLDNEGCEFEYRNSVFKQHPGKYLITHASFRLSKEAKPNLRYDRVQEELGGKEPTLENISQAIVRIRDSKLPRVGELGTLGSFFKNPIVSEQKAQELKEKYEDIVMYEVDNGVKVSCAWLLDYLGYKGFVSGSLGMYDKHALVMVNHGGATGKEVEAFTELLIAKVNDEFGIAIEPEVNMVR